MTKTKTVFVCFSMKYYNNTKLVIIIYPSPWHVLIIFWHVSADSTIKTYSYYYLLITYYILTINDLNYINIIEYDNKLSSM